jgi:hypothetical protein
MVHSCVLHLANLIGKDFVNIGAPKKKKKSGDADEAEDIDLDEDGEFDVDIILSEVTHVGVFSVYLHFKSNCDQPVIMVHHLM